MGKKGNNVKTTEQSQQVFSFKGQILAFVQYIQWPE